jgi:hypothetical protein
MDILETKILFLVQYRILTKGFPFAKDFEEKLAVIEVTRKGVLLDKVQQILPWCPWSEDKLAVFSPRPIRRLKASGILSVVLVQPCPLSWI